MMKRIFMLVALALMVVAAMALSGVAQAASPKARCQLEAETLTGLDLTGYNFIVGNNKRAANFTLKGTEGADVFCGFGGNDSIGTLAEGDIFIGGAGDDTVISNNGTFIGGADNDTIYDNTVTGTFDGGVGIDFLDSNYGTFNGGADDDSVSYNNTGATFNGDTGNDFVVYNYGTFNGGDGNDTVYYPNESPGTFNQDAL
jgi:Ca2+-binding RTX toxin-like protein